MSPRPGGFVTGEERGLCANQPALRRLDWKRILPSPFVLFFLIMGRVLGRSEKYSVVLPYKVCRMRGIPLSPSCSL